MCRKAYVERARGGWYAIAEIINTELGRSAVSPAAFEEKVQRVYKQWSGWIPYGMGDAFRADLRELGSSAATTAPILPCTCDPYSTKYDPECPSHKGRPATTAPAEGEKTVNKPKAGLWRNNPATREGKYLVKRRDGTVVDWPNFVIGAKDPAGPAGLRGYANKARALGMNEEYVCDVFALAEEFEVYRIEHGEGDPDRGKHRQDDPQTINEMRGRPATTAEGAGALRERLVKALNECGTTMRSQNPGNVADYLITEVLAAQREPAEGRLRELLAEMRDDVCESQGEYDVVHRWADRWEAALAEEAGRK
jgi:hypothetical protein